jgi:hypothetical protein
MKRAVIENELGRGERFYLVRSEITANEHWAGMTIAVLFILDGLKSLARDFAAFPSLPFAGTQLSKPVGYALLTALAIAYVITGLGLLRLKRWAWGAGCALWAALTLFIAHQPEAFVNFLIQRQEVRKGLSPQKENLYVWMMENPYLMAGALCAIGAVIPVVLWMQRKRYSR